MTDSLRQLGLYEGFGIEMEYMVVDAISLEVRPIADLILQAAAGTLTGDYENGPMAWSNELALHVIEIKTNGPAQDWLNLPSLFHREVLRINELAQQWGAKLLPTAMHPWMDPFRELQLWPHEYNPVYEAYNRIFDCRGHGWANLQSTHLNLPFGNDEEFGRLHAAIRLLLPLLPGLAASSPAADGHLAGQLDYRLEVYRHNSRRIPSITGRVIPEPVYTQAAYEKEIFQRTYADIAPYDPEGILQKPFLNSRGAIARFDRGAIEIRVLDIQECPQMDVAICEWIASVLPLLTSGWLSSSTAQKSCPVEPLAEVFIDAIRRADRAVIRDPQYLELLGLPPEPQEVREVLAHLTAKIGGHQSSPQLTPASQQAIQLLLDRGPLARRIVEQLEGDSGMLPELYEELSECLRLGQPFSAT